MAVSRRHRAILFALRNKIEHNPAVVYKTIFLGETIGLVEGRLGWSCDIIDLDLPNTSLTSIISELQRAPDAVLIWSEVHQARLARQIAALCKSVCAEAKIFVFGRATSFMPQYFERQPFDCVHVAGDREAAILAFLETVEFGSGQVAGSSAMGLGGKYCRAAPALLPSVDWPFPALSQLPIAAYHEYTEQTHGPNYSKRIAVTAAKGCTWGCAYCGATQEEGRADRRRDIQSLMNWFGEEKIGDYGCLVHLYAPDLFFDEQWITDFCKQYHLYGFKFHWRGVTTTRTLQNPNAVAQAGLAGCRELAIGIETISRANAWSPKSSTAEILNAARSAKDAGITLKGLVMLGYPGQREDDVLYLEEFAENAEMRIRYTGYTPLHKLRGMTVHELDAMNIELFDRRTYYDSSSSNLSPQFFYSRIVANGGYYVPTRCTL